jgi:hypothetical protein
MRWSIALPVVTPLLRAASDSLNRQRTPFESGLDYFGVRYYGSALERFTGPNLECEGRTCAVLSQLSANRQLDQNSAMSRVTVQLTVCL